NLKHELAASAVFSTPPLQADRQIDAQRPTHVPGEYRVANLWFPIGKIILQGTDRNRHNLAERQSYALSHTPRCERSSRMPLRIAQTGDIHLEQDRYFTDTAQCLEWFVEDAIRVGTNLFVVNGDLTTYKQTIQERNLWVDLLIQMGNHAPVILVAGNHGK